MGEARQELHERKRDWAPVLARCGLVAKGVSYGLVAFLALKLALGEGGKAESREGALATIAQSAFGKFVICLLALGFAAYALWRMADALFGAPDDDDGGAKELAKRAGYLARGAVYAALTYSAIRIVASSGGSHESQTRKTREAAAEILSWPAGTWLVGLAGAVLVGAGAYNAYRGLSKRFTKHWRRNLGEAAARWGERLGVVGLVARGAVFGLIGAFLIKAAAEYDPKEAIGLDGALQKLANAPYGPWLLTVVAAGLLAYGVFCVAEARYRDVG
jgi:hypothetical protein